MSIIYLYPSNLDLDEQDIAIAFDEQEKIARPIKCADRKYPSATERQNRDLVMEEYVQHR
jgi:hypothetical protein